MIRTKILIYGAILGWIVTNIDEIINKEYGINGIASLVFIIGMIVYGIIEYIELKSTIQKEMKK